jgi:hypothetical protein
LKEIFFEGAKTRKKKKKKKKKKFRKKIFFFFFGKSLGLGGPWTPSLNLATSLNNYIMQIQILLICTSSTFSPLYKISAVLYKIGLQKNLQDYDIETF